MPGLNKVMLIGRLGKDPEIRRFEDGGLSAAFSLATSENITGPDGHRSELTEWHNIITRNKVAENAAEFLSKGKLVYLEGKIRSRSYEKGGMKRHIVEIFADSFTILEPRRDANPYNLSSPPEGLG